MKISVVTTMYYSRLYVREFYTRALSAIKQLNSSYEFIFVDDGSPDDSLMIALALQDSDSNVKVIELSRNFGHQRALFTGLQFSTGDFVFLIDCDLEENPELLLVFWDKLSEAKSADVIYGVQSRRKGGFFERVSGALFYKMISALSPVEYPANTLTARLMTRHYVDSLLKFKEKELDLWGIFALAGFTQLPVVTEKGHKGTSTYTIKKKIKRALEIITSFSHRPLYFTFVFGVASFAVALINVLIILYKKIVQGVDVEGWASTLASIWLVGGMILFVLGIISIYLSKIFLEIKDRPLTVIRNIHSRQ